jgi:hypothetical protein
MTTSFCETLKKQIPSDSRNLFKKYISTNENFVIFIEDGSKLNVDVKHFTCIFSAVYYLSETFNYTEIDYSETKTTIAAQLKLMKGKIDVLIVPVEVIKHAIIAEIIFDYKFPEKKVSQIKLLSSSLGISEFEAAKQIYSEEVNKRFNSEYIAEHFGTVLYHPDFFDDFDSGTLNVSRVLPVPKNH